MGHARKHLILAAPNEAAPVSYRSDGEVKPLSSTTRSLVPGQRLWRRTKRHIRCGLVSGRMDAMPKGQR